MKLLLSFLIIAVGIVFLSYLGSSSALAQESPVVLLPEVDTLPPTVPTNLTISAVSSSELVLSWVPATDNVAVTGYRVYRRSSATGSDTLVTTLGVASVYADTGFGAGTKFWYSVSAIDAAGNESGKTELRSGRTPSYDRGEADLPAGELGPEITVGIFNYTTTDLRSSSLRVRANGTFTVVKKSGEKVVDIPANKDVRVRYLGDKVLRVYDADTDATIAELSSEVRFEAVDSATIFDISRPSSSYDRYRGDIKLRFYDSPIADGDRIWVINTIPLEHYTWGMGEITGTGADEYDKVMTTMFRTYGYWKIRWSTKYADQGFKVNATAGDQVYYGHDWEVSHPDIRKAAEATKGELVMHGGKIALTAYSAWTDGATRRFEDGHWGGSCEAETGKISEIYPWLSAVPDPKGKHPTQNTCSLAAGGNHMVGLSANGALRLAGDSDWKAKAIMSHYFSGVYFFKGY